MPTKPVRFAAVGLNHNHVYMQVAALIRGGAELAAFYAPEDDLAAKFQEKYPNVQRARVLTEILEDPKIHVITSASIPNERAPLGIKAMRHGKDSGSASGVYIRRRKFVTIRGAAALIELPPAFNPAHDEVIE